MESISEDDNIAVEATGNWYYFYELIEGQTPNVSIAHPFKTRAMASAKVKTDKMDSKTLTSSFTGNGESVENLLFFCHKSAIIYNHVVFVR